jgi:hypothetical protein
LIEEQVNGKTEAEKYSQNAAAISGDIRRTNRFAAQTGRRKPKERVSVFVRI